MNAVLAFFTGLVSFIPGIATPPPASYAGYVEADYVYVAPTTPGTITAIAVANGDSIDKGSVLATLDTAQYQAALDAAKAQVAAAQATYDNLTTGGRAAEVEVARASLAKAQSDLQLARSSAERTEKLYQQGFASKAQLDQAQASLGSANAQVNQLQAQLQVTQLPARDAQQLAAEANLTAAKANAAKARADLADRTLSAPIDGYVERVYYDVGEMAAAGVPLVALMPRGKLKIEFFVPEPDRALLRIGAPLAVSCDGCPAGLTASLSYMASAPQTTPPIIYSREERTRLVFMAEATLDAGNGLAPGQPVSVSAP